MKNLRLRILSALAIGVIILGPLFISPHAYLFPFSIVAFWLGVEYITIQVSGQPILKITIGVLVLSTFLLSYMGLTTYASNTFDLWLPLFCIAGNAIWFSDLYRKKVSALIGSSYVIKAFLYLALNLSCMHIILHPEGGFENKWFILTLIGIWLTDIFAYVGGSLLGRRHLFKSVSPGKSVEGSITGAMASLMAFTVIGMVNDWPILPLILLSLGISASVIAGDLVESKLKRSVGIKDSGKLIPGHGGALDRFDGFLFALPVATLILQMIN